MPAPAGLEFDKILEFENNNLHMLFTSDTKSEIHIKSVKTSGAAETVNIVLNGRVKALGGNSKFFYDSVSGTFLKYQGNTATPYVSVASRKNVASDVFGSVITGTTESFRLFGTHYVITATVKSGAVYNAYYGYYKDADMVSQGVDEGGNLAPVSFYNKYNFLMVSQKIFAWMRTDSAGTFNPNVFSTLTAGSADELEARADFGAGLRVSFNFDKAFILSAGKITIYELAASGAATSVNKISTSIVDDTLFMKESATSMRLEISCKCSMIQATTFVCFGKTLQCVTAAGPVSTDCTVAYTDAVPEFV